MATKGRSTGRVNTTKAGLFDTRLAAGSAAGLSRGSAGGSTTKNRVATVNKRKYSSGQYSQGYS